MTTENVKLQLKIRVCFEKNHMSTLKRQFVLRRHDMTVWLSGLIPFFCLNTGTLEIRCIYPILSIAWIHNYNPNLVICTPPPFSEICHQSQTVKLSTGAGLLVSLAAKGTQFWP
jgi:hypothetical protein